MKKLFVGLFLSLGLFAQSFPANSWFTPPSVVTPYDASGKFVGMGQGITLPVTATDQDYYLSRPKPVQALYSMPQGAERKSAALALALQGFTIDDQIDVQSQSPILTMYFRELYGYTWVPNALGAPVYLPPGLSYPGLATYDPNSPSPGAIKVSVFKEDYAPTDPPSPPPASSVGVVGPFLGLTSDQLVPPVLPALSVYSAMAGSSFAEGARVKSSPVGESLGTFMFHCLGTSLMDSKHRTCVWLGPLNGI